MNYLSNVLQWNNKGAGLKELLRLFLCINFFELCLGVNPDLLGQSNVMFYDKTPDTLCTNTVYGIPLKIYDDFGNSFSLDQVRQPHLRQQLNCDMGDIIVGQNFDFQVNFDDPENTGLNAYPEAQAVICKVLKDISHLIEARPDACNPGDKPLIRIHILESFNEWNSGSYTLGAASALYYNYTHSDPLTGAYKPSVADNSIWKYLNSGQDPTLSPYLIGANYYHGVMHFNFHENIEWNFDYTDPSWSNAFSHPDFYQVVLHEVLHMFGISSLIGSNGQSKHNLMYDPAGGTYSRFDTHLQAASNNLIIDGCYNTHFNPAVSPNTLTIDCSIQFQDPLVTLPIYSPSTWSDGSSLSHFVGSACSGGGGGPYLMSAAVPGGATIRRPTDDEIKVLCAIGYQTSNTYGSDETLATVAPCGAWEAGADDPLCGGRYEYSACDLPISISVDALLANDGGLFFDPDCIDIVSPTINYTYDNATNSIVINSAAYGLNVFSYIPYNASGESMNMTHVFFSLAPCPGDCEIAEYCNLICNPDFLSCDCPDCLFEDDDGIFIGSINLCSAFPDWYSVMDTPDWYGQSTNSNTYLQVYCGGWPYYPYGETAGSFSNILPGNYFLSYNVRSNDPPISLLTVLSHESTLLPLMANPYATAASNPPIPFDINDMVISELNTFQPSFQQVIECVEIADPFEAIYFVPFCEQYAPPSSPNMSVVHIDRIDLIPNIFPQALTTIANAECNVTHDLGFTPACDVASLNALSYHWEYSPNCNGSWEIIEGATSSAYTTPIISGEVCQCYRLVRSFGTGILNPNGLCNSTAEYQICPTNCCPPGASDMSFILPASICHNAQAIDLAPTVSGGIFSIDGTAINGTMLDPTTLTAGTHTVVYTLAGPTGCPSQVSDPQYIEVTECYSISISPTPAYCTTGEAGSISTTITAGIAPYTYLWNTGNTTANLTNLIAGAYSVTVTDATGATISASTTVGMADLPIGAIVIGDAVGLPNETAANTAGINLASPTLYIVGSFSINGPLTFTNQTINMTSGSEIIVNESGSLYLDNTDVVGVCVQLWKHITVFGKLRSFNGTYIRDAHYGIYPQNNSGIHISNTTFDKCFIGVYVAPPPTGIANNNIAWVTSGGSGGSDMPNFVGCTFTCATGTLLQPYPGASSVPHAIGNRTWAGIHLTRVAGTTDIGNTIIYPVNTFESLINGIVLNNGQITRIGNANFNNIRRVSSSFDSSAPVEEGYAIAATSTAPSHSLRVRGDIAPVMITNSTGGVYANRYWTEVNTVNMNEIDQGIYVRNSISTQLLENQIRNCHSSGIRLFNSQAFTVSKNLIDMVGSTFSPSVHSSIKPAAIYMNGCNGSSTFPGLIKENQVTIINTVTVGIRQLNCRFLNILSNIVFFPPLTTNFNRYGIHLSGGDNHVLNCNTVTAMDAPHLNKIYALWVQDVSDTRYSRNIFSNTHTGARFSATCTGTQLRGNTFEQHYFGLWLSNSANLGTQTHFGNTWQAYTGPTISAANTPAQARHDSPNAFQVANSRFFVSTPPGSPLHPDIFRLAPGIESTDWFQEEDGCPWGTASCTGADFECANTVNRPAEQTALSELEQKIAETNITVSEWQPQINKTADKELYAKLQTYSDIALYDPKAATFITSKQASTDAAFYEIAQQTKTAESPTDAVKAQMAAYQAQIESLSDQIAYWQKEAYSNPDANPAMIDNQIASLKLQISNIESQLNLLADAYLSGRDITAEQLKMENDLIAYADQYEQNEKLVNNIYLSTIAKGIDVFTPEQEATLASIAYQCPLAGGKAVYTARSLYALVTDADYDDEAICWAANLAFKTETIQQGEAIQLMPNPATEQVNVLLPLHIQGKALLTLYNTLGQKVRTINLDGQSTDFSVGDITNGLYIVRISNLDGMLFTGKLSIVH